MFYKKAAKSFITCFTVIILLILSLYIAIDPLDMWSIVSLRGINNYKPSQPANLDLFKPYQYMNVKPEVVYIGTSRVYVGMPPYFPGHSEVKVYNMGFSSLSLQDAYQYLIFMKEVHKPKQIYMGLDFFQFGKKFSKSHRTGFSAERLKKLSQNQMEASLYKVHETIGLRQMLPRTVIESRINPDSSPLFFNGWDVRRGGASSLNKEEFPKTIQALFDDYRDWEMDESTLDTLREIVKFAEENNIKMVLYFNPIIADHLAVLDISDQLNNFYMVKSKVAQVAPVWDFAYVNGLTIDRSLFYEASHYRGVLGKKILGVMAGSNVSNEKIGVLLSDASVPLEISLQQHDYQVWKDEYSDYFSFLKSSYLLNKPVTYSEMLGWGVL